MDCNMDCNCSKNNNFNNEDEFHDVIDDHNNNNQIIEDIRNIDLRKLQQFPLDEIRTCEQFRDHLRYIATIANLLLTAFDKANTSNENNNKYPKYALQQPTLIDPADIYAEKNNLYEIKQPLNKPQHYMNASPNIPMNIEDDENYDNNYDENLINTDGVDCECGNVTCNVCTNDYCEADDRIVIANNSDLRPRKNQDEFDEEQIYYSTQPYCYGYLERIDQTDDSNDPDKTINNNETDINSSSQLCYGYLVRIDPDENVEDDNIIYGSQSNQNSIQPTRFQQIPTDSYRDDDDDSVILLTPVTNSKVPIPQQKDLKLCVNCKCAPGNCPVYTENMKMVCPVNCGCCQCVYDENLNKDPYEPLEHCHCYDIRSDSNISLKSCHCKQKADLCLCQDKRQDMIREIFYDDEELRAKAGANNENISENISSKETSINNQLYDTETFPSDHVHITTSKINNFPEEEEEEYKMSNNINQIPSTSSKKNNQNNNTIEDSVSNISRSSKKSNNNSHPKKNGTNRYVPKDKSKLYDIIGEKCLCKECPSDCKEPCHFSKLKPKKPSKINEIKKPLNNKDKKMKSNSELQCAHNPSTSNLSCNYSKDGPRTEFDNLINKNIPLGFQEHLDDLNRKTISLENIIKSMTRNDYKPNGLIVSNNDGNEICIEMAPSPTYNKTNPSYSNNNNNEEKPKDENEIIWYSLVPKNDKNIQEDIEIVADNYPLQLENIKNQSTVQAEHNGEIYEIVLTTLQKNEKTKNLPAATENSEKTPNEKNSPNAKKTLSLNLGSDINIFISKTPNINNNISPQQQIDSNVQASIIPPIQTIESSIPGNQTARRMEVGQNPCIPICLPCIPACCNLGLNTCLCGRPPIYNLFNQPGGPQGTLLQNKLMQPSATYPDHGLFQSFPTPIPVTSNPTSRSYYPAVMSQNEPDSSGVQRPAQSPMNVQNSLGSYATEMQVQNLYNPIARLEQNMPLSSTVNDRPEQFYTIPYENGSQLPNVSPQQYPNSNPNTMISENASNAPNITSPSQQIPFGFQQLDNTEYRDFQDRTAEGAQLPNDPQLQYPNSNPNTGTSGNVYAEGVQLPNGQQLQYPNSNPNTGISGNAYAEGVQLPNGQQLQYTNSNPNTGISGNAYSKGVQLPNGAQQLQYPNSNPNTGISGNAYAEGAQLPNDPQLQYPNSNPNTGISGNVYAKGVQLPNGPQQLQYPNSNPNTGISGNAYAEGVQLPNGQQLQYTNSNPNTGISGNAYSKGVQLPNGPQQLQYPNSNPNTGISGNAYAEGVQLPNGQQLQYTNSNPNTGISGNAYSKGVQLPNGPQQLQYPNSNPNTGISRNAYVVDVQLINGPQQLQYPNSNPNTGISGNAYSEGVQLPNGPQQLQYPNSNPNTGISGNAYAEGVQLSNGPQQLQYPNSNPNTGISGNIYAKGVQLPNDQQLQYPNSNPNTMISENSSNAPNITSPSQQIPFGHQQLDNTEYRDFQDRTAEGAQLPNGQQLQYPNSNPNTGILANASSAPIYLFGPAPKYTLQPDNSQVIQGSQGSKGLQDRGVENSQNRSVSGLVINEQDNALSNISDSAFGNSQIPQFYTLPTVNESNEQGVLSNNNTLNIEDIYGAPQPIASSTLIPGNLENPFQDMERNYDPENSEFYAESQDIAKGTEFLPEDDVRFSDTPNELYFQVVGSATAGGLMEKPDSPQECSECDSVNLTTATVRITSDLNIPTNQIFKETNKNKVNEDIDCSSNVGTDKQYNHSVIQTVSSSAQTNESDSRQEKSFNTVHSNAKSSTKSNKQFKEFQNEQQNKFQQNGFTNEQNKNTKDDDILKVFVQSLFCNLKEMHNIMTRDKCNTVKRFSSRIPTLPAGFQALPPPPPPASLVCHCNQRVDRLDNSYPVIIDSVRPLGHCSLIVKWTVHDLNDVLGYEVCIDDVVTNRYYSPGHNSALIYGVDINSKHVIVVSATKHKKKSFLSFIDKLYSPGNDMSRQWIPSSYIYNPC